MVSPILLQHKCKSLLKDKFLLLKLSNSYVEIYRTPIKGIMMFRLFNLKENVGLPIKHGSDWYNVATGLRNDLDKVIRYYNTHTMSVASDHILAHVLLNINVPLSLNIDRYYSNVMNNANDLSRVLGFSSSVNYGRLFKGKFYCRDNVELIFSVIEDFDYEEALTNWRTLEPIKVMRHPFSGLGLPFPNTKKNSSDNGLCITEINIPLLCIQYRSFRYAERALFNENPDYVERNLYQFIHMYPLANMLRSYQDMVLFNRMNCLSYGIPFGEDYYRHPFHITDWRDRLNKSQVIILDYIKKGAYDFTMMLRSVPMLTCGDLETFSKLPDVVLTRQAMLTLFSSRLNIIAWIMKMNRDSFYNNNKNNDVINRLNRYFIRIKYNNQLGIKKESGLYKALEEDLSDVINVLDI